MVIYGPFVLNYSFYTKCPTLIGHCCVHFADAPRNISIIVSGTADAIVLRCAADANPAAVYQWTDSTSNFTSREAVITLDADCANASSTLTCAAVGHSGVAVSENVTVNWTYSQCDSRSKKHFTTTSALRNIKLTCSTHGIFNGSC